MEPRRIDAAAIAEIDAFIANVSDGTTPQDMVKHNPSQSDMERAGKGRDFPETTSILETHCYKKGDLIRNHNFDWWTICHGPERSGKSTVDIQDAVYTDPTFLDSWEERIYYDGPTFFNGIQHNPKGSSNIFDEAGSEWLRAEWYMQVNANLGKALKVCGYRNLDVHIVTPNWRDLPPNVMRRANDWAFVGLGRNYERGFLEVWGKSESKFRKGDMPYLYPRFYERFPALPWHFYQDYEKFKIEATERLLEKYGVAIQEESDPGMTASQFTHFIVGKVEEAGKPEVDRLRNTRGTFDWHRVVLFAGDRDLNCPENIAKTVASELNYKYPRPKRRNH